MTTKVIFRKFQGEVLALFPATAGDMNPYRTCLCYAHVGQHGAATVDLPYFSRPATKEEYSDLLAELVSIGYDDLKIMHKFTQRDLAERKAQVKGDK